MGTDLPEMTHTYYDPGAVDNPTGFIDGDGNWPEARLYGFKPSDLGQIGTIPGLAPLPMEATILEGAITSLPQLVLICSQQPFVRAICDIIRGWTDMSHHLRLVCG